VHEIMAHSSNWVEVPDKRWPDMRRATVVCVVLAAHIAVLFILGKKPPSAADRPEPVFLPLTMLPDPLTDDLEEPIHSAPKVQSLQPLRRKEKQPDQAESLLITPAQRDSSAPVDWYAEARASAEAERERERKEGEQRSFGIPNGLSGPRKKPPCPFEQCEPGWGAGFSVFERSKRGRIEKIADGEVIRWISNNCYQILVTPNILHRGMNKCVKYLDKQSARGDLFDHMNDVSPPEERGFDVP
jgi:hypothetical protein